MSYIEKLKEQIAQLEEQLFELREELKEKQGYQKHLISKNRCKK